ncbi:MAG: D-2-hydroxyacid dehydrogenase [Gammaproteobacteria bacterium]|nr:D-2-hydroxyacid dehydrogenase [Gammaproteobacteria bacterium]
MTKPLALFLDRASLFPEDLDFSALDDVADWQWFDNAVVTDIQHTLDKAEIIVTNKVQISRDVIESCTQLKLICVAATGVNNIDIEAARQNDITICNVRAYATASVVQHVFSLILSLNRKLFQYKKAVLDGEWSRSEFFCYFGDPVSDLDGKTLGIIGYGELGKAVAKVAKCFGMNVLIANSHKAGNQADARENRVDLKILLASSDIVTLHCPLTENNYHMIGEQEISTMKTDSILINAARGGLVDEKALLHALQSKQIAAAALDVLEEEPAAVNNALINYRNDNLIITPHIAWASRESRQRLVNEIAKNIQAHQNGALRNIV